MLVGLRVSEEVEISGLDLPEHGEEAIIANLKVGETKRRATKVARRFYFTIGGARLRRAQINFLSGLERLSPAEMKSTNPHHQRRGIVTPGIFHRSFHQQLRRVGNYF